MDHFAQRRPAASGRCQRTPNLSDRQTLRRGFGSEPQIDRETRRLVVPDVALQTMRGEAARAGELAAERLIE
jgi:hypothetical protein